MVKAVVIERHRKTMVNKLTATLLQQYMIL